MNIYILSGPVRSGKTSRLLLWIYRRSDVGGILTPVFYKKRYVLNIPAKTVRLLDAGEKDADVITVGDHRFSQRAFDWARQLLADALSAGYRWIVVDEIGFLELHGGGLDSVVKTILSKGAATNGRRLLLVVRENLRRAVMEHYGLSAEMIREFDFPEEGDKQ